MMLRVSVLVCALFLFVAGVQGQCSNHEVDVIIARDDCYGIGSNAEWNAQYDLVITIASKIGLAQNGPHVADVDYGNIASTRLPFTYNLNTAISTLEAWKWYDTTYCNPDTGINQALETFAQTGRDVPQVLVFFSATHPNDSSVFISAAATAKVQGVTIMVLAADEANPDVLQQVVSDTNFYYFAASFGDLTNSVPSIITQICNGSSSSSSSNSNSGSNSGNSGSNSGNSGSNSGNSGSNSGNSGSNSNSNSNSGSTTNSGSSSGSSTGSSGGPTCGLNTCPLGDICCNDGPSSSNPYYCCAGSDACCSGVCCNTNGGYQCYQGVCSYGLVQGKLGFN